MVMAIIVITIIIIIVINIMIFMIINSLSMAHDQSSSGKMEWSSMLLPKNVNNYIFVE